MAKTEPYLALLEKQITLDGGPEGYIEAHRKDIFNGCDQRIFTLAYKSSLEKEDNKEEKLTVARLADGTLVESPTFDVGETVEVISEDGTKSPAPDGEHLLELKDGSGNILEDKIPIE